MTNCVMGMHRAFRLESIGSGEAAAVLLPQGVPEIGVSDFNEGFRPLAEGFAPKLGDAVLGDDVVDIIAGGGHRRAGVQEGDDLGDLALAGGGGHGHDGPAALAHIGPPDKVNLATHPGDLPQAHGGGDHLPHQVNLHAGVDGDQVVILGNDIGIVDILDRVHGHGGVVVHVVVEAAGAHEEGGHALAPVEGLLLVGDVARLGQLHHAVGEHLRVDAQVVLLFQEQQDSIGNGADAQLKGIPVPDQLGHVLPDGPLHLADLGGRQLNDGGAALHDAVKPGDMEEAVPQGPGHVLVDLGDDQVGLLGGGFGVVHRDP